MNDDSEQLTPDPLHSITESTPDADQDGTVDFDYYVPPAEGGTGSMKPVHVSEPISGGSVISWTELLQLQRQSQTNDGDEVPLGSLAEVHVDAISDNDILRSLEREAREQVRGNSGTLQTDNAEPARRADIRKNAAIAPIPASVPELTIPTDGVRKYDDQGASAIDLRTAARTANNAMNEEAADPSDEEDALAAALMADDGSSAINLGLEPRVASLLSSAALVRHVPQPAAPNPVPSAPLALTPGTRATRSPRALLSWVGGTALGAILMVAASTAAWYSGMVPAAHVDAAATNVPKRSVPAEVPPVVTLTDPKMAEAAARAQSLEAALHEIAERLQVRDAANVVPAIERLQSARVQSEREHKQTKQDLTTAKAEMTQAERALSVHRLASAAEITQANARRAEAEQRLAEAQKTTAEARRAAEQAEARLKAANVTARRPVEHLRNMIEVWPELLVRPTRGGAERALADANAILADAATPPPMKAKALVVRALALAGCDDFVAARHACSEAAQHRDFPKESIWRDRLNQATTTLYDADATVSVVRALLAKGDKGQALLTADRGLRIFDQGSFAMAHAQLSKLRADALQPAMPFTANIEQAERHFATGMRYYYLRRFADAEAEFQAASKQHRHDARFSYFLGLTRFALDDVPAANDHFRAAAELEKRSKPGTVELNRLFERIQGPERRHLDSFRK